MQLRNSTVCGKTTHDTHTHTHTHEQLPSIVIFVFTVIEYCTTTTTEQRELVGSLVRATKAVAMDENVNRSVGNLHTLYQHINGQ